MLSPKPWLFHSWAAGLGFNPNSHRHSSIWSQSARWLTIGIGLLTAIYRHDAANASPPTILNLGTLGGPASYGWAINASGQVAGVSYTTGAPHAFLYSGGTMVDLGALGVLDSEAFAINTSGQVVGDSYIRSNAYHAFLYAGTPGSGGTMADLGTFGDLSSARGINDSGQIVGDSFYNSGVQRAFLYYTGTQGSGGTMTDLGTLSGADSFATAISASGQITGGSQITSGAYHAFLYTGTSGSDGAMVDLGTLGGTDSQGRGINAGGQVAGYSSISAGSSIYHAFLYDGVPGSGGVMRDLGTLGGSQSIGNAISSSGRVVGNSYIAGDSTRHAFLYIGTPGVDGQMIDLDAWLDANNPVEGAKWTLSEAAGLTDTGLITGYGTYNDGPGGLSDGVRAFLLDASSIVPEPSTLVLSGVAALICTGWLSIRHNHMHRRRTIPKLSPGQSIPPAEIEITSIMLPSSNCAGGRPSRFARKSLFRQANAGRKIVGLDAPAPPTTEEIRAGYLRNWSAMGR